MYHFCRFSIIFLICSSLLLVKSAWADSRQDQVWLQADTADFSVIYSEQAYSIAETLLVIANKRKADVERLCGYKPDGPISLVLNNDTDIANACAQSVLKKIEFNLAPPLTPDIDSNHTDWLESLFLHEYAHLCHGMNDTSGVHQVLTMIFGQVHGLNFVAPRWWVEGIAVYAETALSNGGRGRNSFVQMQLASNLLSEQAWSRSQMAHSPKFSRPWARIYFWGYDLIYKMNATHQQGMAAISDEQSKWPFWGFGAVWQSALNESLDDLWNDMQLEKKRLFQQQYPEKGMPIEGGYYLTDETDVDFQSPQWVDQDTIIVHADSIEQGKKIVAIDIHSKKTNVLKDDVELQGQLTWDAKHNHLYYSRLEVDPFYAAHFRSQVWRMDQTGQAEPMAAGKRAWSVTVSSDDKMAMIRNQSGYARLVIKAAEEQAFKPLSAATTMSFKSPRFSPDGQWIAAVVSNEGKKDIGLIDSVTQSITALCSWDEADDLDPCFSPDGEWLLFISDRAGSYQLYAWSMRTQQLFKISQAQFGLFQPAVSPDGKWIAVIEHQLGNKENVVIAPLDPLGWEVVETPKQKTLVVNESPSQQEDKEKQALNSHPYQAWRYLAPTFWIPAVDKINNEWLWGIFSGQRDPLEFHEWQGSVLFSTNQSTPYGYLTYTNRRWPINWSINLARQATNQLMVANRDELGTARGIKKALELNAYLTKWYHRTRDWHRGTKLSFKTGWNNFEMKDGTGLSEALLVETGLTFSYGYQGPRDFFTTKGVTTAIGAGFSCSDEWGDAKTITMASALFWPSWFDHQAWKLGLRGKVQQGRFSENDSSFRPRGFESEVDDSDYQTTLLLGYRWPIAYLDQGWAEWPIFFDDIWMSMSYESGWSWDNEQNFTDVHEKRQSSLILEGIVDMKLLWYLPSAIKSYLIYRVKQADWLYGVDWQMQF